MKTDLIIIGGGPAGLFTAIQCKLLSKNAKKINISILEKNPTVGKKLLMTGAGKCNLTQEGDIKDFLKHYGDNKNFIKTPLYQFNNKDLIHFFKIRGVNFVSTDKGKIFPESYKAGDILNILINESSKNGINVLCKEKVLDVKTSINKGFFIKTEKNNYNCRFLVLATGGLSYPVTGSSGDGYKFAHSLGHHIFKPSPALTPIYVENYTFSELAGITLRDINISLWRQQNLIKRWTGDILFTHEGLSGPGILNFSRYIIPSDIVKLQLIKRENESILREELIKKINNNGKLLFKNIVKDYPLPQRLINKILEIADISVNTKAAQLKKDKRNNITKLLYNLPLKVKRLGDFNEAMVTGGGIDLNEIHKKTMESRLVPNLFVIGELLDLDGDTGGYNLQAAFSTAFLAAKAISTMV